VIDLRIQSADFDPGRHLARLEALHPRAIASVTALASASGEIGEVVVDHYPAMARAELARIAEEAGQSWPLTGTIIVFRHGRLQPGDRLAFVGVAAGSSEAALEACSHIARALDARAPFWRMEVPKAPVRRLPARRPREA
jgi:molybdopterin synthase catalytic subunit